MTNAAPSPRRKNTMGMIGFILALAFVAVNVLLSAVSTAVPILAYSSDANPIDVGVLFAFVGVGVLVLAVATTVFGALGLTRQDKPRLLDAIAIGVGGSGVITQTAALTLPTLVGFSLS